MDEKEFDKMAENAGMVTEILAKFIADHHEIGDALDTDHNTLSAMIIAVEQRYPEFYDMVSVGSNAELLSVVLSVAYSLGFYRRFEMDILNKI